MPRLLRHGQPQRQGDLRQRYLGWFDGNPAPSTRSRRWRRASATSSSWAAPRRCWTKAAGGLRQGRVPLGRGGRQPRRLRRPDNQAARELQADALEQLGYQAESGPWRNFYLTGAQELRHGVAKLPTPNTASPDTVRAMSTDLFFDYLGMRLNGCEGRRPPRSPSASDTCPTSANLDADGPNGALSHRRGADKPTRP